MVKNQPPSLQGFQNLTSPENFLTFSLMYVISPSSTFLRSRDRFCRLSKLFYGDKDKELAQPNCILWRCALAYSRLIL